MSDTMSEVRARAERLAASGKARILALESSCDETAAAIVEDGRRVLSSVVASQIALHAPYGGVVPEIASRRHVEALDWVVDQAFERAQVGAESIDAVAVTYGPGLVGALLTGVAWAKAYAYALGVPLVPINHIEGHVSANYIAHPSLKPPFLCLVASGGHSHIARIDAYGAQDILGGTVDDAAGEAFDKVARAMGIPYPGGPLLDEAAEAGDDGAYVFPRARVDGRYDFSFSGLKTAAVNQLHNARQQGGDVSTADFAASFRRAVVSALMDKLLLAVRDSGAKRVALAGGVAANRLLRRALVDAAAREGFEAFIPPLDLCTDNAAMIGSAAFFRLMRGEIAPLTLNAQPALEYM